MCTGAEPEVAASAAGAKGAGDAVATAGSVTQIAMEDAAFGAGGTAMAAGATGAQSLAAVSAAESAAATAAGGAAAGSSLFNTIKPYGTALSGAASVATGLKTLLSPSASGRAAAPGLPAVAAPTPMPFFNDDAARAARREFLIRRGSALSRDNTILTGEKLGN